QQAAPAPPQLEAELLLLLHAETSSNRQARLNARMRAPPKSKLLRKEKGLVDPLTGSLVVMLAPTRRLGGSATGPRRDPRFGSRARRGRCCRCRRCCGCRRNGAGLLLRRRRKRGRNRRWRRGLLPMRVREHEPERDDSASGEGDGGELHATIQRQ